MAHHCFIVGHSQGKQTTSWLQNNSVDTINNAEWLSTSIDRYTENVNRSQHLHLILHNIELIPQYRKWATSFRRKRLESVALGFRFERHWKLFEGITFRTNVQLIECRAECTFSPTFMMDLVLTVGWTTKVDESGKKCKRLVPFLNNQETEKRDMMAQRNIVEHKPLRFPF